MDEHQINQTVKKGFPWVARVLALIAIIAFFLPFCTVSCSGQDLDTVSAAQMAAGKEFSAMGQSERVDGDAKVFVLLLLPVAVIGFSFIKKHIVGFVAYIAEAIAVLAYNSYLLNEAKEACQAYNCTVRTEIGYVLFQIHGWIMILLGAAGIIATIVLAKKAAIPDVEQDNSGMNNLKDLLKPFSGGDRKSSTTPPSDQQDHRDQKDGCDGSKSVEPITLRSNSVETHTSSDSTVIESAYSKEPADPEVTPKEKTRNEKDLWNRPTGF